MASTAFFAQTGGESHGHGHGSLKKNIGHILEFAGKVAFNTSTPRRMIQFARGIPGLERRVNKGGHYHLDRGSKAIELATAMHPKHTAQTLLPFITTDITFRSTDRGLQAILPIRTRTNW